ncbi:MAG: Crp/Fnr family transcriptional regulator [Cytophagales bacterium]|nr:MAG: Crp/Fnr family transcriptional regulator [Cytophagales bacterium]TAF61956.1 MAG: Crp/Fnr family transcriptional regulator [Cytophagales bacterium]
MPDIDKSLIIKNISKHITLDNNEEKHFLSILKPQKIKKKAFLLKEGDICRATAFVINGCMKSFTVDKNGFERVLNFAPVDWWTADMFSLISQRAAILNIQAIADTQLLLLSKQDQEALYFQIPKFERFFRIIIEKSLVAHQMRVLDGLSLTAEQRYIKFCEKYPQLWNQLPQKEIASYIGVTPEFFSKMKRNMD